MNELINQIKTELANYEQKKQDIDKAMRVVDNLFSGRKNTCAKCGSEKRLSMHKLDDSYYQHDYIPSIYVGDLEKSIIVYSIENVCNVSITNRGLRIDAEEIEELDNHDCLPSSWYEEVRLNILNHIDYIIKNVYFAIRTENSDLQIFDSGIGKIETILKALGNDSQ